MTAVAPDFDAWVAARGSSLVRLAHVLTGGTDDADDIVRQALSRSLARWSRISRRPDPEASVRRLVVVAHLDRNRARWWRVGHGGGPAKVLLDRAVPDDVVIHLPDVVWQACRALAPDQRTALVLRFYEGLGDDDLATLTRTRPAVAAARVSLGLATLRCALGTSPDDLERVLRDSLARAAEQAPASFDLTRGARAELHRRRARMTRVASVAAVAMAAAALVPIGSLVLDGAAGGTDVDQRVPVPRPTQDVATERPVRFVVDRVEAEPVRWRGITLEVPAEWQRGSTASWCARRGTPAAATPRVSFPADQARLGEECTPRNGYGVTLGPAGTAPSTLVSGRVQRYDPAADAEPSYPDDAWIFEWHDEDSVVTVVTPDPGLTDRIAASIRRGEVDANGCAEAYDADALPTAVGSRGLGASLCRYAPDGGLDASSRPTADETERLLDAIEAAPTRTGVGTCADGDGQRITLTPAGQPAAVAVLGGAGPGCEDAILLPGGSASVELTDDVRAELERSVPPA